MRAATLLGAAALICGCGNEQATTPEQQASSDVDALRAIGYAGVSEESVDPSLTGVVLFDHARSQPGYNLYTNRHRCQVILMNAGGDEVHRWERPADRAWSNAQLLANGDLLVIGQERSKPYIGAVDEHRYLLRLSWSGEVLWRADVNAHHDVEVTPDGKLALLSFKRTLDSSLTHEGTELREDLIQRLDLDGQLIDERSLLSSLTGAGDGFELGKVAPSRSGRVSFLDLIHANSLEFMSRPELAGEHELYAPGNVLVSMRHQDGIFVMNWESGEHVWSWGHGELLGPHDATVLDGGNLLIFDNGLGRGWSRVIELDPREGAIVWEYRAEPRESFYTASRGSSQRLSGGNTLIAESDRGRAFEVTPTGETVWSWVNPDRDSRGRVATLVRMKRLGLEFVDAILASH